MIVVPARPVRRLLIVLGVALLAPLVGLLGYYIALQQMELDRNLVGQLSGRAERLASELEALRGQLADAKLAGDVDSRALAIQREEMVAFRETIRELREQLGFYQRLMDPSSSNRPLEIADLELSAAGVAGDVRYRLLLTRPTDSEDWVGGTLWLDVKGLVDGKESVLSLTDVANLDSYPIQFRFRYFQRFSGSLRLPEGFRPQSVLVRVAYGSEKPVRVDRSFPWSAGDDLR